MAEVKLTILGEDKYSTVITNWENKVKSAVSSVRNIVGALGVTLASLSIGKIFTEGVSAVDDFQQSVIKTAAMITSLQGGKDVAENYRLAKDYATGLQDVLGQVDANTSMNVNSLTQMTEEMVKQGVILDINNKKQIEAFTSLANAVAVYSQNGAQEIQVRQEVRALMMGEVDVNSQLASMLQKTVDGPLKEKVKQWKESGVLMEEIGKRLTGFNAASGDISNTWSAISSTFETIVTRLLRGGFSEVVKDLVGYGQEIGDYLKEHEQLIGNRIKQGWLVVKSVVEVVVTAVMAFKGPLTLVAELTGTVVRGWSLLVVSVIPALTTRMSALGRAIWENVKLLGNMSMMLWEGLKGNISGAVGYFDSAVKNWNEGGRLVGEAFAGGLGDEISRRANEFLALDKVTRRTSGMIATPKVTAAPDMSEITKQFKERAKNIIAIEKERVKTLIDMEKEYLDKVKNSYQGHVDELQKFVDATRSVYQSMEQRDKAEATRRAALLRGPEDGLNRYKRLQTELLEEESKIDGTWADPAEKIKRYNDLITTASEYNQAVVDNNIEIISSAETERDYMINKLRLSEKIRSVVEEETRAKEAAAIKDAENMMAAEARIKRYENRIQILDDMLRNLPQVKNIDVNVKINGLQDLYNISSLMNNAGVNQQGTSYGDYYTQGGKTYWADGSLAEDGTSTVEARANGGPVKPYATYRINEDGTEYLTMGSKGGYVTPADKAPGVRINIPGGINVTIQGGSTATETARDIARKIMPELQRLSGNRLMTARG